MICTFSTSLNFLVNKWMKRVFLGLFQVTFEFEQREHDWNSALKHTSISHAKSLNELKFSQSHCSGFSCDWLTPHEPKPHSNYQLPLLTKGCVWVCVSEWALHGLTLTFPGTGLPRDGDVESTCSVLAVLVVYLLCNSQTSPWTNIINAH